MSLLERYESMRRNCLAHGNLHPDSKEVCHQAIAKCNNTLAYHMALLLDDMAIALGITGDGRGEAATIAGLESATGHLSALVDDLRSLMARAMANMKALHDAAKPADESRGDFDAKVPYDAFVRFVDAHAALLSDLHNSPHELPSTPPQQQQAAPVVVPDGLVLVPVEPNDDMLDRAVSFALNVQISGDYTWTAYMRDLWARMLSAAPKPQEPGA